MTTVNFAPNYSFTNFKYNLKKWCLHSISKVSDTQLVFNVIDFKGVTLICMHEIHNAES